MKRMICAALLALLMALATEPVEAHAGSGGLDPDTAAQLEEQLDALGRDELMAGVPEEARELMEEAGLYDMSFEKLLELTPGQFFPALWRMFLEALGAPARTLTAVTGVVLLCALLDSLRVGTLREALSGVFQTVSVLCVLTAVAMPILDCILHAAGTIKSAATFMLGFVPIFAAAMASAGQPVSGAVYNMFLMGACQLISQVVSQTLIPMMSVYLAICVCGSFVPDFNIASAAEGIRSAVNWTLGFLLTLFVALLSIQSILSHSADGVTTRAAKFLLSSLVPMAGSALSDAYMAAQGCLKLLKTTVGAYGISVALFTFLPVFLRVTVWLIVTRAAAMAGDILGAGRVSVMLKSCGNVLGMLLSALLCFALLMIVSTTVVLVTGMGG